jgi:response regulator RpfG family c-di-GMP phosphodiesterase
MKYTFDDLIQSLDMAVFLRKDKTSFKLVSPKPSWLNHFCSSPFDVGNSLDLGYLFPFVDCFLHEAEIIWKSGICKPYRSGAWVELLTSGGKIPLEATAFCSNNDSILIIQDLGEKYVDRSAELQELRENILTREQAQSESIGQKKKLRACEEEVAFRLLSAASHRDQETAAHVTRIGLYAEAMAKALGWSDALASDIQVAAPMHDIGKIGIPDSILLKPGKLTEDEFEIMKEHAAIGADMLKDSSIDLLNMGAEIAYCHHERWDGKGYPRGLKGEEIPLSARITTIVDVYDALCHKRVYKKAFDQNDTLSIMSDMVGTHFDPALYSVFIENLPVMQAIKEQNKEK